MHPKTKNTIINFIKTELKGNHSYDYQTGLTASQLIEKFYQVPKTDYQKYGWGHAWNANVVYQSVSRLIRNTDGLVSENKYDRESKELKTKFYISGSSNNEKI